MAAHTTPSPAEVHAARAACFRAEAEAAARRASRISGARLVVFLGAVAALVGAWDARGAPRVVLLLAGFLLLGAFAALVRMHAAATRDRAWRVELARGSDRALARLRRHWTALPAPVPREAPPDHPYAADLDVFGRASLAQLLGSVATTPGRRLLHDWLSGRSPAEDVVDRQAAVAELAPMLDLRDVLAARGRLSDDGDAERADAFVAWAGDQPWLEKRAWLRVASFVVPATTLTLAALGAAGLVAGPWWAIGLLAAAIVTALGIGGAHKVYERASTGEDRVAGYAAMFELLAAADFRAPLLRRLHDAVGGTGQVPGAARSLRRLERILDFAEVRRSTLAYLPLQLVLLWDLHVVRALERWQRGPGRHAAAWLSALGQADALAALAALAHDHPDWALPRLLPDEPAMEPAFRAEGLGHPLLAPDAAVRNDVVVGPPGSYLLVTGSNMSGKSTLLRAIGLNAVLAQAGGPVCATMLTMPPLELWTSMRVTDSLERGVSHFMAELERLKAVVDAATRLEQRPRATLLYLVDEVLQGTNSAERQVAARRIIRYLVQRGAIGAVTTHDLELADAPELERLTVPVHFRETVHTGAAGPPLTFDYRLRPGVATSRNALKLMEIVGLGDRQ